MRRKGDRYECAMCGEILDVADAAKVRTMLIQGSGTPTMRAVLVDGKEIHRCAVKQPA
jgi:hypothetical protein